MSGVTTGGTISFAPLGTSLDAASAWTPIPGMVSTGWIAEAMDEEMRVLKETITGHTLSLSFTMTRREIRRVRKMFPLSPGEARRSAMRSEYHRRAKHR